MRLDIITIFPDYFAPLKLSLVGKAIARGDVDLRVHDLRDATSDVHRTVDDSPYGGGPGMVMTPGPWGDTIDAVLASGGRDGLTEPCLLVPTPSGRLFSQTDAAELSECGWVIIACARYEGIDARVVEYFRGKLQVDEVSLGDYVLSGGEVAALVIVEAFVRLRPGVLGNERSHQDDSFSPGDMADRVEGPVYTRPPTWRGLEVPPVLRSGDHGAVREWQRRAADERTRSVRPDLGTT